MASRGNSSSRLSETHADDDVSLIDTLILLWRYKLLALGVPGVLAVAALLVTSISTPQFEAISKVEVTSGGRPVTAQTIESFRTQITSLPLAERVVASKAIDTAGGRLSASELAARITAQGVRNSAVILIRARSSAPQDAATLANAVAEAAVTAAHEAEQAAAAARPDARLEASRRALERFYEQAPKSFWDNARPVTEWPHRLTRAEMEYDVLMAAYKTALAEYVEGRAVAGLTPGLTLADRASVPSAPVWPKPLRTAGAIFAIALGSAVVLIIMVDAIRGRLAELR